MEQLHSLARIQEFKRGCVPFLAMNCMSIALVIASSLASIQAADCVPQIKILWNAVKPVEIVILLPSKSREVIRGPISA